MMKKKVLSLVLALAMLMSLVTVPVYAAPEQEPVYAVKVSAVGFTDDYDDVTKFWINETGAVTSVDLSEGSTKFAAKIEMANHTDHPITVTSSNLRFQINKTVLNGYSYIRENFTYGPTILRSGWTSTGSVSPDQAHAIWSAVADGDGLTVQGNSDAVLGYFLFSVPQTAENGTYHISVAPGGEYGGEQYKPHVSGADEFPVDYTDVGFDLKVVGGQKPIVSQVELASASVEVDGSTKPGTIQATAKNTQGGDITDLVSWSVAAPIDDDRYNDNDVLIGTHNGVITISPKAKDGIYTIKASSGQKIEAKLKVTRAEPQVESVTIKTDGGVISVDIPTGDTPNTLQLTAVVKNQYGTVDKPGVTWTFNNGTLIEGVTLTEDPSDSSKATLSVAKDAQTSRETAPSITATIDGKSDTVSISLVLSEEGLKPRDLTVSMAHSSENVYLGADGKLKSHASEADSDLTFTLEAYGTNDYQHRVAVPVDWSIEPADQGISIDSEGQLKVTDMDTILKHIADTAGSSFTITGTAKADSNVTACTSVTIKRQDQAATSMAIYRGETKLGDTDTAAIPSQTIYTAKLLDQYGSPMETQGTITLTMGESLTAQFTDNGDGTGVLDTAGLLTETIGTLTAGTNVSEKSTSVVITAKPIEFVTTGITVHNDKTYGARWNEVVTLDSSKLSASVNGVNVEGIFSVKDADQVPDVNGAAYMVEFTSEGSDPVYDHVQVAAGPVTIIRKDITANTGTLVISKDYDGDTNSDGVRAEGTLALDTNAIVDDDTVTVSYTTTGAYNSADAGTDKQITVSDLDLGGADAANYNLTTTDIQLNNAVINKIAPVKDTHYTVTIPEGNTYTGETIDVIAAKAGIGDDALQSAIEITYGENNTKPGDKAHTNAGTYAVTVTIAESTNFTAVTVPLSVGNLTIGKASPAAAQLEAANLEQVYTGSELKPTVTAAADVVGLGEIIVNTKSTNVTAEPLLITVSIAAGDNYEATTQDLTLDQTFTVKPKSIAGVTVAAIPDQEYTGSSIEPAVTVTDTDTGVELKKDIDYTVVCQNNQNIGAAAVTITGRGNYDDQTAKEVTFQITRQKAKVKTPPAAADLTYTGEVQELVTFTEDETDTGTVQYKLGADGTYSAEIPTATDAGDYQVWYKVVPKDAKDIDPSEPVQVEHVKISRKSIEDPSITVTVTNESELIYKDAPVIPAITVSDGETELTEGIDYTVTFTSNVNARSTAEINLTGKGNYNNEKTDHFTILPLDLNAVEPVLTGEGKVGSVLNVKLENVPGYNTERFRWTWYRNDQAIDQMIDVGQSYYTVTEADLGKTITVKASTDVTDYTMNAPKASNGIDVAKVPITGSITIVEMTDIGTANTIEVGDTLGVDLTGLLPAGVTGTYQWSVTKNTSAPGKDEATVIAAEPDLTAETYAVQADDDTISVVFTPDPAKYTSGGLKAEVKVAAEVKPVIKTKAGIVHNKNELTAEVNTNIQDGLIYTWYRDGVEITDAKTNTYITTNDDLGHTISVRVTHPDYQGALTAEKKIAAKDPNQPVIKALTPGDRSFTVTWDHPAANGSAIVGYGVQVANHEDPSSIIKLPPDATSYTVTGLTNGIEYSVQLNVYFLRDVSSASASSIASEENAIIPAKAPGAPTGLAKGEVTQTSVELTWTAPDDNGGSAITGYEVYQNGTKVADTAQTACTVTGLKASTTYSFTVKAVSQKGKSADSEALSVTTEAAKPDPKPEPGQGGSSSSDSTTVRKDTTTNPDGSTTETVTKRDGTVIETTKGTDGSKTVTETRTDKKGTRTDTVTETTKAGDKTVTVTKIDKDGSTTSTTEVRNKDGSTSKTTVDRNGKMNAEVEISDKTANEAAKTGEPVVLPMPEVPATSDTAKAPTVTVKVGTRDVDVDVIIPMKDPAAGIVAILVHPDGTKEILPKSLANERGLSVIIGNGATIEIVDNAMSFTDADSVKSWAGEAMDFVSSHGLFGGTGDGIFEPDTAMNRGMLATVLHRLERKPASDGENMFADVDPNAYYGDAIHWATANGIVNGYGDTFAPAEKVTREQMVTMLWRFAGKPVADNELTFNDAADVSDWATDAMGWAISVGLINGLERNMLAPGGYATRAQTAAVMMRFVDLLVN